MTRGAVCYEKVFYWIRFLVFESQKFLSLDYFMKCFSLVGINGSIHTIVWYDFT